MNIGIPKERRPFEYRVGMSPAGVHMLVKHGHTCYVEHDAGIGAGFSDQEYQQAGARIVYSPREVFGRADLLLKVARPLLEEIEWLQPGATVAGLLHMASARQDKIDAMLKNRITAIGYEMIQDVEGHQPVREPLSMIGGRLVAQIGARLLQNNSGGKGILLGGIPGVPPAEVAVVGAGVVGSCAARAFHNMGAHVTVLDVDLHALQRITERIPNLVTMISNSFNLQRVVSYADVVVGAIFNPGERAPIIISRQMVASMKPRSVILDVSIDEGGCVETSRPTTHEHSTFIEEGVIHYCVPNIPSLVARSSTHAFVNSAFPFIQQIADLGSQEAIARNSSLQAGVNLANGDTIHLNRIRMNPDLEGPWTG